MSYRSLKRMLGETNLERKCRLLFGVCLFLLIAGSFGWVWRGTEELVYEKDRATGRHLVDASMLKFHWQVWENRTSEDWRGMIEATARQLQTQKYEWKFVALDENPWTKFPEDEWESETLAYLKQLMEQQSAELAAKQAQAPATDAPTGGAAANSPTPAAIASQNDIVPVFRERRLRSRGEYQYYQPVYWRQSCAGCHNGLDPKGALSAADSQTFFGDSAPLRVVKIVIPDRPTQQAINKNRAILIATGIITVFVAMVALYVIVKYVIVKPLKHLRDVSDDVSRGKLDVRADIHTNDEFEELAASFNRMLRHLIDAQGELQTVNHDLDHKVDQLAQANMQLYEMNRIKSDFLANMSHELRTPLNSIIGFSEVLRGVHSLQDKQKRYVENIQTSGRLLLDMINDILDLAKMESGKMEVHPSEFSIYAIVSAHCDLVRSLTEEKNIDLEVEVDRTLPPLYQDQAKVQQVLTNLLSNAIKFTPEGGRIVVHARRLANDQLELTVSDTGVGIAEEDREIIFEKFRQGSTGIGRDNLTREYSGTGLGLSIVKELCILLGGEVRFTSELGKGSTFTILLPWVRADQPRLDSSLTARLDDLSKPHREMPRLPASDEVATATSGAANHTEG